MRWRTRSYHWSDRQVALMMHDHDWKDTSRRVASQTSSFSSRWWIKVMVCWGISTRSRPWQSSSTRLALTLLGSLSESCHYLVTALESWSNTLTWELLFSRLLHEDMKRKEQGGGIDGAAHGQSQAFMTNDNIKSKGRQALKESACPYYGEHVISPQSV